MTGQELLAIRESMEWSQERLAHYFGYSLRHYAATERGDRPVNDRLARQVLILQAVHRLCVVAGLLDTSPFPFR